jgi:peptide deformylase
MILPIVAYGDPVLKKEAGDIAKDYPELKVLIANMFETMYEASGVGLAAPQIGRDIRLFIVDGEPFADEDEDEDEDGNPVEPDPRAVGIAEFKQVFINPKIVEESGEEWSFREGCLSIPKVREDVFRKEKVRITYYDENWEFKDEYYDGYAARIIQHEYDHIEGVLFTDHLSAIKKKLISNKLVKISKGEVVVDYKMKFPSLKKGRR